MIRCMGERKLRLPAEPVEGGLLSLLQAFIWGMPLGYEYTNRSSNGVVPLKHFAKYYLIEDQLTVLSLYFEESNNAVI